MAMIDEIRERRDALLAAARRRGAISLRLFGSVARREESGESDVDFLVRMAPGKSLLDMGGLQMDLSEILGRRVDLVSEGGLRPRFRERALRDVVAL